MLPPHAAADSREPLPSGGSWAGFAAWAADELGVRLAFDGKSYRIEPCEVLRLDDPNATEPSGRKSWFARRSVKRPAVEPGGPSPESCVAATPAEVLSELVGRLAERDTPANAKPLEQPTAVHDLADRLFAAYELDEAGRAHLAGCHLIDVPLVRLTWVDTDGESPGVLHAYFNELGEPVEQAEAGALGLDHLACAADPLPTLASDRLERMLDSARRATDTPPALVTLVWAKRVEGRVRFEFGEETLDAPFAGWAKTLVPPPAKCPQTGEETFHLSVDDNGLIAAAEAIGRCQVSGARRLRRDLVTCAVSQRLVDPSLTAECPVLAKPVLADHLTTCPRCGEAVAQTVHTRGGCLGCDVVRVVAAGTPEARSWCSIAPELAKTLRWRVGETATRRIARSRGLFVEWLVVLDKATGDPVRVRRRHLLGSWSEVELPA